MDWNFKNGNQICNFRSVGVLIHEGNVLIQKDGDEYALPGGCVKIGETAEKACIREFAEETGLNILCKRMIWVDESFWSWNGLDAHTIAFYFLVDTNDVFDYSDFSSQKDNCNILLEWKNIAEVKNLNIYPDFIKSKITDISDNIEHFVYR